MLVHLASNENTAVKRLPPSVDRLTPIIQYKQYIVDRRIETPSLVICVVYTVD